MRSRTMPAMQLARIVDGTEGLDVTDGGRDTHNVFIHRNRKG